MGTTWNKRIGSGYERSRLARLMGSRNDEILIAGRSNVWSRTRREQERPGIVIGIVSNLLPSV